MTEMESPLEDYADGLRFHFDGYFIWRLLYRRVGDALRDGNRAGLFGPACHIPNGTRMGLCLSRLASLEIMYSGFGKVGLCIV